ncbi:phosphoribosyltransferase family protein [Robertmurraya sp. Marseille-Q9965]
MITRTLTYSNNIATYKILDELKVEVKIQQNVYGIPLEDLFLMAARINKKRAFLFVSKVLGKHIPIQPAKGILVGSLLAARYLEERSVNQQDITSTLLSQFMMDKRNSHETSFIKDMNPIVIGFAETATALGHAFFEAFKEADYFHTTREWLDDVEPVITFEEEHSHATSHRAYIKKELLNNSREIILVDDELTTGKTALNIIRSIHASFPRTTYTVVSILDWRSDEHIAQFKSLEAELGIEIHSVSLVKGTVSVEGQVNLTEKEQESLSIIGDFEPNVSYHEIVNPSPTIIKDERKSFYTSYTGRFGITAHENRDASVWVKETGIKLAELRTGRTLILGTGEYMYLPMKIASYMGEGVFYQSTTRSPIYPVNKEKYGATNRYSFPDPMNHTIQNYVYNISPGDYEDLFLFFERKVESEQLDALLEELKRAQIPNINVIYFDEGSE